MQNTLEFTAYETAPRTGTIPQYQIDYAKVGIGRGLQAGAVMSLYLIVLHAIGFGDVIWMKFLKYILLGTVLGIVFKRFQRILPDGELFKNAIIMGAYITFIAALTIAFVNLLAAGLGTDISFQKYSLQSDNLANNLLISGVLFFETLVGGMILSFILIQAFKRRPKGKRSI